MGGYQTIVVQAVDRLKPTELQSSPGFKIQDSIFQEKFSENLESRLKPIEAIDLQSSPGFKIQDLRNIFLRILNPD